MASLLDVFAQNLKYFRTQTKISQGELSDKADVDQARLSRIENGQIDIGISTLEKLANGLGVTPEALLSDPDNPDTALKARLSKYSLLTEKDQTLVQNLVDSLLEKAELEKSMNVKVKKRLEEIGKVRKAND